MRVKVNKTQIVKPLRLDLTNRFYMIFLMFYDTSFHILNVKANQRSSLIVRYLLDEDRPTPTFL